MELKECPKCKIPLIKRGWNKYKNGRKNQRKYCKSCKKYFYDDPRPGQAERTKPIWTESRLKKLKEKFRWSSQTELEKEINLSWKQIQNEANRLHILRRARGNQPIILIEGEPFNYSKNAYGYILISNPDLGVDHKMAHIYVWEKHYGAVPLGMEVHHKDSNPSNYDLTNLMLVKRGKEHTIANGLSRIINECHQTALEHNWWDFDANGSPTRNIGESIMLIMSELSEANEGFRNGDLENATEELADTCIRLFDFARGMKLPLEEKLLEKMRRNKERPPRHGKAY
jgi:NTP pyrophosphatase (non-canonical NTP hydrolase)